MKKIVPQKHNGIKNSSDDSRTISTIENEDGEIYQNSNLLNHNLSIINDEISLIFGNCKEKKEYNFDESIFTIHKEEEQKLPYPSKPLLFIVDKGKPNNNIPKRDRRDYILNHFKNRCMKYIVKELNNNSYPNLHFYLPNSLQFTSVINYDKNRAWLNWTIEEILLTYGDKKVGSNKKSILKLEYFRNLSFYSRIKKILSKTFWEVILEYSNSQSFMKDLTKMEGKEKELYEKLGGNGENSFIHLMRSTKGNTKRKTKNAKGNCYS